MAALPPILIYLVIGAGAAVENFIPPIPADTFVLLGAFIAASGRADPITVFLVTWVFNVAAAVGVYWLAWRYGTGFFATSMGRFLLQPRQLRQIGSLYERWGVPAIFVSRFLPAFRALVPVFAGVTHVPLRRVLPPLALASALWYGALVYIGAMAGRNWDTIMLFLANVSTWLLAVAAVLVAAVAVWWWRTRRADEADVV
ncbi:MAG TPA: DedA family protein [Longimicrobiales bacterium]|nr:DedA family protein [Longimicrobiales bacterium]